MCSVTDRNLITGMMSNYSVLSSAHASPGDDDNLFTFNEADQNRP